MDVFNNLDTKILVKYHSIGITKIYIVVCYFDSSICDFLTTVAYNLVFIFYEKVL